MALSHALLTVDGVHGFQYGMLRDFEGEIVRLTGARTITMPSWPGPKLVRDRLAHGTRFAPLRRFAPQSSELKIEADVLWMVLMGPEASALDLFRGWDAKVGYRIVYVYDTFEHQLGSLKRLAEAARWDLMITSFHGAVPMLERETGRPWIAVPQGVLLDRFAPVPAEKRDIGFSSYGRRLDAVNGAIDRWSDESGVYFDATVASGLNPKIASEYLYKQYAWHLRHSWFTVAWPVEVTSPERAAGLSPVTCRWFEAAAAGTTLVGAPPKEPIFEELFGPDLVVPLAHAPRSPGETREAIAALWEKRDEHLAHALARRAERMQKWTWEARVREILARAQLS
jgi:hypothetical protein